MANLLTHLSPVQRQLVRALVALIAFSSLIDAAWQKTFDVNSWYEYQGTEGPFLVTETVGEKQIGKTPITNMSRNSTLVIYTNVCFKPGVSEEFYRVVTRRQDDEVVSTAERELGVAVGCMRLVSLLTVPPEWQAGQYEIHRAFVLSSSFFGRFSNNLPVITIDVNN